MDKREIIIRSYEILKFMSSAFNKANKPRIHALIKRKSSILCIYRYYLY